MRKARMLLFLGVWVAVLPYLGFPYPWKNVLFVITGAGLIYFSYVLYQESKMKETKEEKIFDNFSENKFVGESDTISGENATINTESDKIEQENHNNI